MILDLSEPVRAAMIDDDIVFLDIDADTYFCLPLPPGLARLDAARLDIADPLLVSELTAAGLAVAADPARPAPPPLPPRPDRTARALIDTAVALEDHFRPAHLAALAKAVGAAHAGRRKTFRQLLPAAPRTDERPDLQALLADVSVWRRWSPWLPLDGVCLFRSGMLLAFLTALGHRPDWVFGVRTWPFRAHCWLQADDVVLDDEAERVCAYTPIMAV